jgi:hypothetical protein
VHGPSVTLASVDGSAYLAWQAELLVHSHRRCGQSGSLEILTDCAVIPGDRGYPPYNKPYAVMRWAQRHDLDCTVIVLDPDMVFTKPLSPSVSPRRIIAQRSGAPLPRSMRNVVSRQAPAARSLTLLEPPLIVHGSDLPALTRRWLHWTIRLRADPDARLMVAWLCEMWALALAVKDLGLKIRWKEDLACVPPIPCGARFSLVHYAWRTSCFDKRTYTPWTDLPACPHDGHRELQALIISHRNLSEQTGTDSGMRPARHDCGSRSPTAAPGNGTGDS